MISQEILKLASSIKFLLPALSLVNYGFCDISFLIKWNLLPLSFNSHFPSFLKLCRIFFFRSSRPEVFLRQGALKICSKFTEEHQCRSAISIKLQSNFTEIAHWHGYSPLNLLHIFRTPFLKNTSGRLLLFIHTADGFISRI